MDDLKEVSVDFKSMFNEIEFPFSVRKCDKGWYSLGFPFLYTDNDGIEIYAQLCPDGTFLLTDDGWTIDIHSGGDKRNIDIVKRIVNHLDYTKYNEVNDEITATATKECFAAAVLEMISV